MKNRLSCKRVQRLMRRETRGSFSNFIVFSQLHIYRAKFCFLRHNEPVTTESHNGAGTFAKPRNEKNELAAIDVVTAMNRPDNAVSGIRTSAGSIDHQKNIFMSLIVAAKMQNLVV